MSAPSVCVTFNNVDEASSIGSLCAWSVRTALEAGWRVTVVARDLDPLLQQDVEWIPMYVPPRLHAVQWYSALPVVRRAIRGRRFDVVHVQQPQLASLANLLHLHYLVRSARLAAPPQPGRSWRQRAGAAQVRLTEVGESWHLAHLPERLVLAPVSAMLRDEYIKHYGPRERICVMESPAPDVVTVPLQERAAARHALVGHRRGQVVGFLGGDDPRKGGAALLRAMREVPDSVAVVGGSGSSSLAHLLPPDRFVDVGYVTDKRSFFAGLDAFAAVSSFDPGPLTALEAAAHGVPVMGTSGCGYVRDLAARGGAVMWEDGQPLGEVLARLASTYAFTAAGVRLVEQRSRASRSRSLISLYHDAIGGQ